MKNKFILFYWTTNSLIQNIFLKSVDSNNRNLRFQITILKLKLIKNTNNYETITCKRVNN